MTTEIAKDKHRNREQHNEIARPVRRKQFQSCDRCRKARRACDAVARGINPLNRAFGIVDGEVAPEDACSQCHKTKRPCTFRWLSSIPQDSLPRSVRRNLGNPQVGHASRADSAAPIALHQLQSQPFPSWFPAEVTPHVDFSFNPNYEAMYEDFHALGSLESSNNGVLGNDSTASANLQPADLVSLPGYPQERTQPQPYATSNLETHAHSLFTGLDTLPFHNGRDGDGNWPASRVNEYSLCHLPNQTSLPPTPFSQNPVFSVAYSAASLPPENPINHTESAMAQETNKSMIIVEFRKIYENSLENALECWLTEGNCPYQKQLFPTKTLKTLNVPKQGLVVTSIYNRVRQLEASLAPLRKKPLCSVEVAGASKTLRAVIMAFASQWSRNGAEDGQQRQQTTSAAAMSNSGPFDDVEDFLGFEMTLRESLWNEAQRLIGTWGHCDSFLIILAQMIFALTQSPSSDEDINPKTSPTSTSAWPAMPTDLEMDPSTTILADRSQHKSSPYSPYSPLPQSDYTDALSSDDKNSRVRCLDTALRHLLAWKKHLEASAISEQHGAAMTSPLIGKSDAAQQLVASFGMLFWFGVMCDTTTCVLSQRALIIADGDTAFVLPSFSNETGEPRNSPAPEQTTGGRLNSCLWGTYLIEQDRVHSTVVLNGLPSTDDVQAHKHRVLQDAIPIKVLLWRKLGTLEAAFNRQASPQAIESLIAEALQVYEYWNANYGGFFEDCIASHGMLSFKTQSWYVILAGHWHLACLRVAKCIEQIDKDGRSDGLRRALRQSSALVLEMQKASIFAIATLARVSCSPSTNSAAASGGGRYHSAMINAILLTEPWTDVLHQALTLACYTLLDWYCCWQDRQRHLHAKVTWYRDWVYHSTELVDLYMKCSACVDGLMVLSCKSSLAMRTALVLKMTLERHDGTSEIPTSDMDGSPTVLVEQLPAREYFT